VQAEISQQRQARMVVIGAGFDTRAFRLDGGRWLEVDEPAIISHKDAILPAASAKNPLERVAIEFATESLLARLAPYRDTQRTHMIVEGVFMYLTHPQRRELLGALRELFPGLALILIKRRGGLRSAGEQG
jgi:O-methyltransferase involved in polyketide biosynthesis